ncbi:MAG TPA: hypothetical protein VGH98_02750 [Gemmatimonadaceae bacterium]
MKQLSGVPEGLAGVPTGLTRVTLQCLAVQIEPIGLPLPLSRLSLECIGVPTESRTVRMHPDTNTNRLIAVAPELIVEPLQCAALDMRLIAVQLQFIAVQLQFIVILSQLTRVPL